MSDEVPADVTIKRRAFLLAAGGAGVLAVVPAAAGESHHTGNLASKPPETTKAAAAGSSTKVAYHFLNAHEAALIEAAVDTLIPSDEIGPGALELGVATYIDGQLAGGFGQGARRYMLGPFADGTPQQGWQIAMTPAELVRAGIADVDAYTTTTRKKKFADLTPAERVAVLQDIEAGKTELATVPSRLFFNLLLSLTYEGYFGDPIYGGNRGLGSWKMIGFPGVARMYAEDITTYRNRLYPADPKSIEDYL